jgi:hypothetical protein
LFLVALLVVLQEIVHSLRLAVLVAGMLVMGAVLEVKAVIAQAVMAQLVVLQA